MIMWEWTKWKLENANKISRRTNKSSLIVPAVSDKVSDTSKKIAPVTKQQAKNSACQGGIYIADAFQGRMFCHPILVTKGVNSFDIRCETSAVYSSECMCKA